MNLPSILHQITRWWKPKWAQWLLSGSSHLQKEISTTQSCKFTITNQDKYHGGKVWVGELHESSRKRRRGKSEGKAKWEMTVAWNKVISGEMGIWLTRDWVSEWVSVGSWEKGQRGTTVESVDLEERGEDEVIRTDLEILDSREHETFQWRS